MHCYLVRACRWAAVVRAKLRAQCNTVGRLCAIATLPRARTRRLAVAAVAIGVIRDNNLPLQLETSERFFEKYT